MNEKKKSGTGFLSMVIGLVLVGVLGMAFTSASKWIGDNDSSQEEAKISLNEIITSGKQIPLNEYVGMDVRWVIGPYAHYTLTSSTNGFETTERIEYYYYLFLEDGELMSLKARNAKEVEELDKMSEWLLKVDGFPTNGKTIHVQGEIKEMKDEKLLGYFNKYLSNIGFSISDPQVHHLILDTTARRKGSTYIFFGIGAVALVIIVVIVIRKKMKEKGEMAYNQNRETETTDT